MKFVLDRYNINSKIVHGDTPKQDRDAALELFSSPDAPCECRFLIATFSIVKEGLNLTGANHLIQMDPPETYAEDMQSQDRYVVVTLYFLEKVCLVHLVVGESQLSYLFQYIIL